ncbi:MAG: peptidase U34 [Promethearchaeota archaeon]|nr:MAG: peptidase U34 [Candidatus Lokiarchaeota archaeon]
MCDTLVAIGNSTKDGSVIFAKNTDREPNEAHNILYIPRQQHSEDSEVDCTYISIPQLKETNAVLLLKPFWMFGCEMGANEYGVTIGNEAVWTKEPYQERGLLGMDLMRLALERSKNAEDALNVIIDLLELYGQGGACGYKDKKLFYHNSFIIADPKEAWVLETADQYWIAEKVKDIRVISNTLTIGNEYDKIHPNLIKHAVDEGYCNSKDDFNFADCFIPKFNIKQIFAKGRDRIACTSDILRKKKGKITPETMMSALRSHNIPPSKEKNWAPYKGSMKSPCMHYTSFITPSQSVGSHVAHLKNNIQTHWVTGTSAPCTGIFKPIFFISDGKPIELKRATEYYDDETLWWQHEKLHRAVLKDYQTRLNSYRKERNELEAEFKEKVENILTSPPNDGKLKNATMEAFELSRKKTSEWINLVQDLPIESKPGYFYRKRWQKLNDHDQLDINMK